MLNDQNESHGSLCQGDDPLSGLRDAWTSILSADKQVDRTSVGVKVVTDYPVSLFPVGGILVAGMVKDLIEPVLFLGILLGQFGLAW